MRCPDNRPREVQPHDLPGGGLTDQHPPSSSASSPPARPVRKVAMNSSDLNPFGELGFPLWVRLTHWFNVLFLTLLARSGLAILAAHPKLYWNIHCRPGSEWLRFTRKEMPSGPDVVLDRRGGGLAVLAGPARRPRPGPGPVLALLQRPGVDALRPDLRRAAVPLAPVAAAGADLLGDHPRCLARPSWPTSVPAARAAAALYLRRPSCRSTRSSSSRTSA